MIVDELKPMSVKTLDSIYSTKGVMSNYDKDPKKKKKVKPKKQAEKVNRYGLTEADVANNKAIMMRLPKKKNIVVTEPINEKVKPVDKKISSIVRRYIDYIRQNEQVSNIELTEYFNTDRIYQKKFRDVILSTGEVKYDSLSKLFYVGDDNPSSLDKDTVENMVARYIKNKKVVHINELRPICKNARAQASAIKLRGLIKTVTRGVYQWIGD